MSGTAQRVETIGAQLGRAESRLAEVEREIANLDAVAVEATWVARCLADFGTVVSVL